MKFFGIKYGIKYNCHEGMVRKGHTTICNRPPFFGFHLISFVEPTKRVGDVYFPMMPCYGTFGRKTPISVVFFSFFSKGICFIFVYLYFFHH